MKEVLLQRIEQDCLLISNGVRAAALIALQYNNPNDFDEIKKIADRNNVKFELKPYWKDGWTELWIFEDDIVRYIINELPDKPNLPSEHYLLGKLFGYSDDKIFKYCKDKAELNDPNLNDVTSYCL